MYDLRVPPSTAAIQQPLDQVPRRPLTLFALPVVVGGVASVEVTVGGFMRVRHVGVISDRIGADGQPMIVHASKVRGLVAETTATEFVKRQVGPLRYHGYPGQFAPDVVVARARARIGQPYEIVRRNCEHLVAEVHGLPVASPQLQSRTASGAIVAGTAAMLVAAALTRRR